MSNRMQIFWRLCAGVTGVAIGWVIGIGVK